MSAIDEFEHVEKHAVRRKVMRLAHGLPGLLWYEYFLCVAVALPFALGLFFTVRTMAWVAVLLGVAAALGLVQLRRFWDGRREYVLLWLRERQGGASLRILDRDVRFAPLGAGEDGDEPR